MNSFARSCPHVTAVRVIFLVFEKFFGGRAKNARNACKLVGRWHNLIPFVDAVGLNFCSAFKLRDIKAAFFASVLDVV